MPFYIVRIYHHSLISKRSRSFRRYWLSLGFHLGLWNMRMYCVILYIYVRVHKAGSLLNSMSYSPSAERFETWAAVMLSLFMLSPYWHLLPVCLGNEMNASSWGEVIFLLTERRAAASFSKLFCFHMSSVKLLWRLEMPLAWKNVALFNRVRWVFLKKKTSLIIALLSCHWFWLSKCKLHSVAVWSGSPSSNERSTVMHPTFINVQVFKRALERCWLHFMVILEGCGLCAFWIDRCFYYFVHPINISEGRRPRLSQTVSTTKPSWGFDLFQGCLP